MKTAEEILQGYNQFRDDTFGLYIPKEEVIEAMVAYASQFRPKWISVNDRLPDKHELVIVTNENDDWVCVGQINDDRLWYNQWESNLYGDADIIPTHWMSLPKAPTK
jgi:hypothetical protein